MLEKIKVAFLLFALIIILGSVWIFEANPNNKQVPDIGQTQNLSGREKVLSYFGFPPKPKKADNNRPFETIQEELQKIKPSPSPMEYPSSSPSASPTNVPTAGTVQYSFGPNTVSSLAPSGSFFDRANQSAQTYQQGQQPTGNSNASLPLIPPGF